MILTERAARLQAEAVAASAKAEAADAKAAEAMISYLKLGIEKLRRQIYGSRSDRKARLLEQMELELEELDATATEPGRVTLSNVSVKLCPEPPRVCRRLQLLRGWSHDEQTTNKFSPEIRTRAVRMVLAHASEHASLWAAVMSISAKIGCTPQTLHDWVKKAEVDSGQRAGVPTDTAERLKALERENRELRQANEILRKASAYFAMAELDRRSKP
jgi:transposase